MIMQKKKSNIYKWINIRTITRPRKLKKKTALDREIVLEKSVLKSANTQVISEEIQRRHYLLYLTEVKQSTGICAKQRQNYNLQCPTALDDTVVIN